MPMGSKPSYEELERRLAHAESALAALQSGQVDTIAGTEGHLVVRLARAEAQAEHIKNILLTIRRVHQLLAAEDDPLRLIERVCRVLIQSLGYDNAWIALLDSDARTVTASASAGFGGKFSPMARALQEGRFTRCMDHTLDSGVLVVVDNPDVQCPDCPLSGTYSERSGFSTRLEHDGSIFGILSVCVSPDYARSDEEQGLFRDLAGDLAFALHRLSDARKLKDSEAAVLAGARYLDTILRTSADGFIVIDDQGVIIDANEAYGAMSGYDLTELIGMTIADLDADEVSSEILARVRRIVENGSELFEVCHRRKDGSTWPVEVSASWLDEEGAGRLVCFCRDLTERKQREERIALLGQMLDAAPACITIHDTSGRFVFANRETWQIHGYEDERDFLAVNLHDLDVPESEELLDERFRQISEQGEARFEVRHYRKDRSIFPLEIMAKLITWDGRPAVLSIATDISERKQREDALRESEERFRRIYQHMGVGVAKVSLDFRIEHANEAYCRMLGYSQAEIAGRHLRDITAPEILEENLKKQRLLAEGAIDHYRMEKTFIHRNGKEIFGILDASAVRDADHKPLYFFGSVVDISDRKRAEEALRRSENRLQKIFEVLPIGLWFADKDGRLIRGNPMGVKIWGAEPHVALEEYGVFKAVRLPSRQKVEAEDWALSKTIRHGVTIVDELLEIEAFDGRKRVILNYTAPVLDERGDVDGAIVINLDITDRVALEDQLRQAQKMESVGRLAGGVAHDFNNMLGVILGHAELALDSLSPDDPLRNDLLEIMSAGRRSADITRQLLAFASKQTIAPKIIDLNRAIEGMIRMLGRLIGENIRLVWMPGNRLRPLRMDPGQIDQILANLCVNARDAIDGTGTITIETRSVSMAEMPPGDHPGAIPGDYVAIIVRDDGQGMDKDTLERLFEPFFTTKALGKGTGLGLSTVYGIVRQNKGFITVDSEKGSGTVFSIYLPAHGGHLPETEGPTPVDLPRARGSETVLLVEDERAILTMATLILRKLGYTVLTASGPREALERFSHASDTVDLLITDVIMPGMNGRELADRLSNIFPGLSVLFMSGYTADVIADHGVLDDGVSFIQKPFSRNDLALKIREVLDGKPGGRH
ncbi:hypothetical protein JCM14469_28580 [Desulfatiferula olefinivorans]